MRYGTSPAALAPGLIYNTIPQAEKVWEQDFFAIKNDKYSGPRDRPGADVAPGGGPEA